MGGIAEEVVTFLSSQGTIRFPPTRSCFLRGIFFADSFFHVAASRPREGVAQDASNSPSSIMSASVFAALQRMHLFRSLSTSELERIVGSCSIVTLSSGQVPHLPAFPSKTTQHHSRGYPSRSAQNCWTALPRFSSAVKWRLSLIVTRQPWFQVLCSQGMTDQKMFLVISGSLTVGAPPGASSQIDHLDEGSATCILSLLAGRPNTSTLYGGDNNAGLSRHS